MEVGTAVGRERGQEEGVGGGGGQYKWREVGQEEW